MIYALLSFLVIISPSGGGEGLVKLTCTGQLKPVRTRVSLRGGLYYLLNEDLKRERERTGDTTLEQ